MVKRNVSSFVRSKSWLWKFFMPKKLFSLMVGSYKDSLFLRLPERERKNFKINGLTLFKILFCKPFLQFDQLYLLKVSNYHRTNYFLYQMKSNPVR